MNISHHMFSWWLTVRLLQRQYLLNGSNDTIFIIGVGNLTGQ